MASGMKQYEAAVAPTKAALFAALYIGETLGPADAAGGALLVGACLANAVPPDALTRIVGAPAPAADNADAANEAS